jgi:hypothetical protein
MLIPFNLRVLYSYYTVPVESTSTTGTTTSSIA